MGPHVFKTWFAASLLVSSAAVVHSQESTEDYGGYGLDAGIGMPDYETNHETNAPSITNAAVSRTPAGQMRPSPRISTTATVRTTDYTEVVSSVGNTAQLHVNPRENRNSQVALNETMFTSSSTASSVSSPFVSVVASNLSGASSTQTLFNMSTIPSLITVSNTSTPSYSSTASSTITSSSSSTTFNMSTIPSLITVSNTSTPSYPSTASSTITSSSSSTIFNMSTIPSLITVYNTSTPSYPSTASSTVTSSSSSTTFNMSTIPSLIIDPNKSTTSYPSTASSTTTSSSSSTTMSTALSDTTVSNMKTPLSSATTSKTNTGAQSHFESSTQPVDDSSVEYHKPSTPWKSLPSIINPTALTNSVNHSFLSDCTANTCTTYLTTTRTQNSPSMPSLTTTPDASTTYPPITGDLFDARSSLDHGICPSKDCAPILSLMDHSVDPCADFYSHACGGLRNPEMLDHDADSEVSRTLAGQISSISRKDSTTYGQLKRFYDSCVSYVIQNREKRIHEVFSQVKNVGWFHDKESWEASHADITDLLTDFFKLDSAPLFDILLDKHETNSSKLVLKLVPPLKTSSSVLDTEEHVAEEARHANAKGCGEELAQVAGVETTTSFEDVLLSLEGNSSITVGETLQNLRENIAQVIEKYLPFEDYFRWILVTKKYDKMTLEDLQRDFAMVNWTRLTSTLLAREVDNTTEVHVYYKSYLQNLFHYLNEIDLRLLYNSLLAVFAKELYDNIVDPAARDRRQHCVSAARDLLPDVAASLYLRSFPNDTAGQVQDVFDRVKSAMAARITSCRLLDERSRRSALEKLGSLYVVSGGGRDVFQDLELLDRRMQHCHMDQTDYLANTMKLRRRKRQLMYALFTKEASAEEQLWTYLASPLQTQEPLFYDYNKIVVPYAMLPKRRAGATFSEYAKSELGVTLGRMMAHHFDFTGIRYGPNGTKEDILSANVYRTYWSDAKHRVSEMISKMDKSVLKHRRSRSLLANDFASNQVALNMALSMFEYNNKSRKEKQLFFLALAQASCQKQPTWDEPAPVSSRLQLPSPARVNAVFSQTSHFSLAYSCPVGTNMNPQVKIPSFPEVS